MPDTLPFITPKPAKEVAVPDNIKEMTFSIKDFETEQLPEQGTEQVGGDKAPIKVDKKLAPKSEVKETNKQLPEDETKVEDEKEESTDDKSKEKVEEKKDDGVPKYLKPPKGKEEPKQEDKSANGVTKAIVPPTNKSRDFTGFTQEEAAAGKQMSNEAFEIYKRAITNAKELRGLQDTSYLQHPKAYMLDEGFQESRLKLTRAQQEAQYWETQLTNASENGADVIPLQGWNSQTGEPIYGQPIKPTKAIESKLGIMIGNCYRVAQDLQGKLAEYPTKYKSDIKADVDGIEQFQKQQFGWEQDPKLMEYSIPVEGLGDRTLKQIKDDVYSIIPKWAHSHPLAKLTANLVIALRCKQAEMVSLTSEKQVEKTQEEEQERVEPSSRNKPSSNGKNGELVHGMKEFRIDPELMS